MPLEIPAARKRIPVVDQRVTIAGAWRLRRNGGGVDTRYGGAYWLKKIEEIITIIKPGLPSLTPIGPELIVSNGPNHIANMHASIGYTGGNWGFLRCHVWRHGSRPFRSSIVPVYYANHRPVDIFGMLPGGTKIIRMNTIGQEQQYHQNRDKPNAYW